jgi:hypothetical protein
MILILPHKFYHKQTEVYVLSIQYEKIFFSIFLDFHLFYHIVCLAFDLAPFTLILYRLKSNLFVYF